MSKAVFLRIFSALCCILNSDSLLVMPPASPTHHQLTVGLGVPLSLEAEAVLYGWVIKAQYMLPESTAEDLKWTRFPDFFKNYTGNLDKNAKFAANKINQLEKNSQHVFPHGRRKRDNANEMQTKIRNKKINLLDDHNRDNAMAKMYKIQSLNSRHKTNRDYDTSGIRWQLYDALSRSLVLSGFEGKFCVLRAICDAAKNNFGYHSGLFGQLLHIIFSPSSTSDKIVNKDHYDYVKAEMLGREGAPCGYIFHRCKRSLMEIFTKIM